MKIRNSTSLPTAALRAMLTWLTKECGIKSIAGVRFIRSKDVSVVTFKRQQERHQRWYFVRMPNATTFDTGITYDVICRLLKSFGMHGAALPEGDLAEHRHPAGVAFARDPDAFIARWMSHVKSTSPTAKYDARIAQATKMVKLWKTRKQRATTCLKRWERRLKRAQNDRAKKSTCGTAES